jgi:hypothetical protein
MELAVFRIRVWFYSAVTDLPRACLRKSRQLHADCFKQDVKVIT